MPGPTWRRWPRRVAKNVTIEPMLFLLWFGHQLVYGAGVGVDLLILKVCRFELGYNETVCANLKDERFKDLEAQVQIDVNKFEVIRDWVYHAPPIFFAAIAGALSDRYGRKPLLVFPIVGFLLRGLSSIFIYTFLEELPLATFILEEIDCFFGGLGVFHLGVYGYAATITNTRDRAHVMARFDGVESLSQIIGAALSPILFRWSGFYGNFMLRALFTLSALLYTIFLVEEPLRRRASQDDLDSCSAVDVKPLWRKIPSLVHKFIVKSAVETIKTLFRRRPGHMRTIIFVQFIVYACYKFSNASFSLTYLFMKRAFNAENYHYALLRSVLKGLQAFCLLIIMPILTGKLGIHETIVVGFTTLCTASAMMASAFAGDIWSFLFCRWGTLFRTCQYGAGRALLTKSVNDDEVAKILSGKSLIFFMMPFIALPTMRLLYNSSLDSFPGSYIVLAASLIFVASFLNFGLYTQKQKFNDDSRTTESAKEDSAKDGLEDDSGEALTSL